MNSKFFSSFKRVMSFIVAFVMVVTMLPITTTAEEVVIDKYPYTMFAASDAEGAITVNAGNVCINGNVATNGTIVSSGNMNINGTKIENAGEDMIYIFNKIDYAYFLGGKVDEHSEDYSIEETNINISIPTEVEGEATLTGNININTALKVLGDISLYGEVKNTSNSVIFSKYGNIVIDSTNVNLNGLLYAPFGNVIITSQNLNLNNVVIIAQSITITSPNVNANFSDSAAEFVGKTSEALYFPPDEWEHMEDSNQNGLPDFFEDAENWSKLLDTDGEGLPDCFEDCIGSDIHMADTDGDGLNDFYEFFITFTDPTMYDSDENGISDGDEDFDEDGLTNLQEYEHGTEPYCKDTDDDGLTDGDEVNIYNTNPLVPDTDEDGLEDADEILFGFDPLNPDTDGNGILDGDEKHGQTFVYENEDSVVEEVTITMEATGNLQKTTEIENIMDIDIICSETVGLVGEPFSIETDSKFDKATISFKVDKSKLVDTAFDDLMFLWYDEENYEFVELETLHDEENSIVSVETTHFSKYMIVDSVLWFDAWVKEFNYNPDHKNGSGERIYNTVLAIDCSGSMDTYDPITVRDDINSAYESQFINTCKRISAAEKFITFMNSKDKAAIVLFSNNASIIAPMMTKDLDEFRLALQKVTSSGGTDFNAAISKSLSAFNQDDILAVSTYNRIILLSDGEASISNYYLERAIEKGIKIYTIGLGSASGDDTLKYISDYTGGEFYKAYKSDELLDIYTELGFGDDFDTTDTDGDGLYDAVEAAGIRIQNGNTIYGCDPSRPDTDSDGLDDGKEIDPKIRCKVKHYLPSGVPESYLDRSYYFVMKSNPVESADSDGDGYDDVSDFYPMEYNDYSFLDNETYYIYQINEERNNIKNIDTSDDGSYVLMNDSDDSNSQKFKFEWCENGYKIYPIDYESSKKVLTVDTDNDSYRIILAPYEDKPEQLWEVLPIKINDPKEKVSSGLIFRSKMTNYSSDEVKSFYLSSYSNGLMVTESIGSDSKFKIHSTSNWIRFGEVYLNHFDWENTGVSSANYYFTNYALNKDVIFSEKNFYNVNGKELLIYQDGGAFDELRFGAVNMDGVCCEIMATYNALLLADVKTDFCKLAFEFEYNAMALSELVSGTFGSDPKRIGSCLDAYNVSYTTYDTSSYGSRDEACEAYDKELADREIGIVSYRFRLVKPDFLDRFKDPRYMEGVFSDIYENILHIRSGFARGVSNNSYIPIHTFAVLYNAISDPELPVTAYNRYSNDCGVQKYKSIEQSLKDGNKDGVDNNDHFMIGYALSKKNQ